MEYEEYTLKNGLKLVHLPLNSEVAYCGYAINVGTRDEENGEFGMAHFVEHLMFKGTETHKASYILNRMEGVGGELNAYTTKEDTFVYSVFMHSFFKRAAELLTDIVFHSTFPEKELRKESDVILEEINSYKDTPSELIFDEFENLLFEEHPLGHAILGEEEEVKRYTSKDVVRFVHRTYAPAQMVFFSVGKMDFKQIKKTMSELVEEVSFPSSHERVLQTPTYRPFRKVVEKDTFQTHVLIGNLAYPLTEEKARTSLYLLNNILGGPGMNSRLNLSLREKNGWVYEVESSANAFTDTGMFSIYFACDKHNEEKCLRRVMQELKRFREEKLSSIQLDRARKQLYGQLGISNDNHESLALALGKSFLRLGRFDSLKESMDKLEKLTPLDLQETANFVFEESKLSILSYH